MERARITFLADIRAYYGCVILHLVREKKYGYNYAK